MLTLLAALFGGPVVADTASLVAGAPPIQVTLNNSGSYAPGGLVNVRVETRDDGYLIVFRVDGDGRIRVLFPLDPDADAFVRGGKEYELRGRGDRSTFLADDRGGSGMVYAALSHQSYNVRDFSANGHWDYDALRLRDSSTDAENDLTVIVGRMTNRARFDYDAIGYRVQDIASIGSFASDPVGGYYPGFYDPYYNPSWRCLSCGWGYPGADINIGFGYSPFWDPWLYSPWGYHYGYGFGYGYTGRDWWYGNNHNNYPVGVVPRPVPELPPGTRSRPRPQSSPSITSVSGPSRTSDDPGRYRPTTNSAPPPPPPTAGRTNPPPTASPGTRARPRPSENPVTTYQPATPTGQPIPAASPSGRPSVFRQPQSDHASQPRQQQPQPQSRPVYREPPRQSAPPPPPPQQSSAPRSQPAPQARTASPPPPPPASRPRGGGG